MKERPRPWTTSFSVLHLQPLKVLINTEQPECNVRPVRPLQDRFTLTLMDFLDALVDPASRIAVPESIRFRLRLIRRSVTHRRRLAPGTFAAVGNLGACLPSRQTSDIVETADGPVPLQLILELSYKQDLANTSPSSSSISGKGDRLT